VAQIIEDAFYQWAEHDLTQDGERTFYICLQKPVSRPLSREEAQALLTVSRRWIRQARPSPEYEELDPNDPRLAGRPRIAPSPETKPASGSETKGTAPGGEEPVPNYVIGTDDRVRVTNTGTYPWSTVSYVSVIFSDGIHRGSAALISRYCALTCGHVVYNIPTREWGFGFRITPGQRQDTPGGAVTRPFGSRTALEICADSEYLTRNTFEYDIGAAFFETPFDGISTFMPVVFDNTPSSITLAGYPKVVQGEADSDGMWQSPGVVVGTGGAGRRELRYTADTSGGNSGGPVWASQWGSRRIVGVHVFGGGSYNGACRLVSANQSLVTGWQQWGPWPPTAPAGVSATDGTRSDAVVVSWNGVSGATHYRVSRATSSSGTKTDVGAWQTGTTYHDTSATQGVTHYYWVRAARSRSGHYESTYSSYNTGWRALSAPAGVSATDGTHSDKVRVTWNEVEDASHYRVSRAESAAGAKTALGIWQTDAAYDDATAASGITYYYWVQAATSVSGARASDYGDSDTGWKALRDQTIDFPPIPDQALTNVVTLRATATSGLDVEFTVRSGPALLSGQTNLSFTGTGSVSVVASQGGDADWYPASPVTNMFRVLHGLTLTLPRYADEGDGAVSGRVHVAVAPDYDVTVLLTSSDDSQARPFTNVVVIRTGQTDAAFDVLVDDGALDGSQNVTVTATATNYVGGSTAIRIHDDEVAVLGVALPASCTEGQSIATGRVTVSAAVDADVAVTLSSDDSSEISVPERATIPAGGTNVSFRLDVHDDALIDGTQTATVTAHVENWAEGRASIAVLDNEPTNLVVSLPLSAVEGDGVLPDAGTVSVLGRPTNDLHVSLVSDDLTEVAVTSQVTIVSGTTSVTFDVSIQNDGDVDGVRTAKVSAVAVGFAEGWDTIAVQDNEGELRGAKWSDTNTNGVRDTGEEGLEGWKVYVDLNTNAAWDVDEPLTLTDSAGNYTLGTEPGERIIAEEMRREWIQTYPGAMGDPLPGTYLLDVHPGQLVTNINFGNTPPEPRLIVELPARVSEADGTVTGRVSLNVTSETNVTALLSSSDDGQAHPVQEQVVIPAGQSNAVFELTVDDDILDGTQSATVTASATNHHNGAATILIDDDESTTLELVLPPSATEGDGTAPGQVIVGAAVDADVVVWLASDRPDETTGPSKVTVLAGRTNALFDLTVHDDMLIDKTQTATITAHVENWGDAHRTIEIRDNEHTNLVVTLSPSAMEGDGLLPNAGTVGISGTLTNDLIVRLSSIDTTELIVTSRVTIAAGTTSVQFAVSVVDDGENDSVQTARVVAAASGFAPGDDTMAVQDNEGWVRGRKWWDENTNGTWDAGEDALEGWRIYVDTNTNAQWDAGEAFDVTDTNGSYAIGAVPGMHIVGEQLRDECVQSFPGAYGAGGTGLLTFVEHAWEGKGGVDCLDQARWVTLSPDGRHVYVASYYYSGDKGVAVFARDLVNGSLTYVHGVKDGVDGVDGLGGAHSVAVSPDGLNVYATGSGDNAVAIFSRDPLRGRLAFVDVVRSRVDGMYGLDGAAGIAISADGRQVYVAGSSDSAMVVFDRNPDGGRLTRAQVLRDGIGGVTGLRAPKAVAIAPGGDTVHVAAERAVTTFERNPTNGLLHYVETLRDGVNGVDGLYGVESVAASPDGKHVYTGSYGDDAVVIFARNPTNGRLTYLEKLDSGPGGVDGLQNPRSVAVAPDGSHVYATGDWDEAIVAFERDAPSGALTHVQTLRDRDGGLVGLSYCRTVAVSPDGTNVYAGNALFRRAKAGGQLTYEGLAGSTSLERSPSFAISPDGGFFYAAAGNSDSLLVFQRSPDNGRLIYVHSLTDGVGGVDGLDNPSAVAITPDGDYLYAAGEYDDAVAIFRRDQANGRLTYANIAKDGVRYVDGLDGACAVTVSPDGNHVYVAGHNDNAVAAFRREPASSALTFLHVLKDGVGSVDGLGGVRALAISPDGRHVYAASEDDNAVAVFQRNPTNGVLSYASVFRESPARLYYLIDVCSVTVSPTGDYVYTAAPGTRSSVAVFRRDPLTGALAFVHRLKDGVDGVDGLYGAHAVTVSPNGRHVYACGSYDHAVAVFCHGSPLPETYQVSVGPQEVVNNIDFGNVLPQPRLIVDLPVSATEGDGAATGHVRLNRHTSSNLIVYLQSDDLSETTVSNSVTIAPGQTNAAFELQIHDDGDIDGSQRVTITASGAGYRAGSATFMVHDSETATLTLALAPTTHEGEGVTTGRVTIGAIPDADVFVRLHSDDTSEITVPSNIVVASGRSNASFAVTVVDDREIDGVQIAGVYAHVENWVGDDDRIRVLDNESTNLRVSLRETAVEGDGTLVGAGLVSISGTLTNALPVSLVSHDRSEVNVTGQVTIAAGTTSVTFDVTIVDDTLNDGPQTTEVSAAASGFGGGSDTIVVQDSEGEIRGRIWHDANTNAIHNIGEEWIEGRRVYADLNTNGQWDSGEPFDITGADGAYAIGVEPGAYTVGEQARPGWVQSFPGTNGFGHTGTLMFVEATFDGQGGADGLDGAQAAVVSPDGLHVYVAAGNDDAVTTFRRDRSTGRLSYVDTIRDGANGVDGLNGAGSITLSADGNHAYVAGTYDNAVVVLSRDAVTGRLTSEQVAQDGVDGVEGLRGACAVAISPDGLHAYVAGQYDDSVVVFGRDPVSGRLSYAQRIKDGFGADGLDWVRSVAISLDGEHVYTAGYMDDAVGVFSRNPVSGELTYLEAVKDGADGVVDLDGVSSVIVSPDGNFAYAASEIDDAIVVFYRDRSNGHLTFAQSVRDGVDGVDGLDSVSSVVLGADGKLVYGVGWRASALAVFRRDAGTGKLTFLHRLKDGEAGVEGLIGPDSAAPSADGRYVYVASVSDDAVAVLCHGSAMPWTHQVVVEPREVVTGIDFGSHPPASVVLSVRSAHGSPSPATGDREWPFGAELLCSVIDSPVPDGVGIRHVCTAAEVSGNAFTQISPTSLDLILTNNTVLTWLWQTQHYLDTEAGPHGRVTEPDQWVDAGSNVTVAAIANDYFHFARWQGTVFSTNNPLPFTMSIPHSIMAEFSANLVTNGMPEWWMARHGWTNDFVAAATNDEDGDGMLTVQEWIADTDPTNAESCLSLLGLQPEQDGVRVVWRGGRDATQWLEYCGDQTLSTGTWIAAFTNLPPTATTTNIVDEWKTNRVLFYRIRTAR